MGAGAAPVDALGFQTNAEAIGAPPEVGGTGTEAQGKSDFNGGGAWPNGNAAAGPVVEEGGVGRLRGTQAGVDPLTAAPPKVAGGAGAGKVNADGPAGCLVERFNGVHAGGALALEPNGAEGVRLKILPPAFVAGFAFKPNPPEGFSCWGGAAPKALLVAA